MVLEVQELINPIYCLIFATFLSALCCIIILIVSLRTKKYELMSFKQAMELLQLPVISFYVGKQLYNFLLDTGSNDSHINKDLIDNNLIKYSKNDIKSTVVGITGNSVDVDSCTIVLNYNGKAFSDVFLINDMSETFKAIKEESGITLHGILGSKFFEKYRYVLDFNSLSFYHK